MAIPGSVLRTEHAGSNRLIKEGARSSTPWRTSSRPVFPTSARRNLNAVELDSREDRVYSLIGLKKCMQMR
jgi:predicted Rossmann fold nucleotide-binding protein DprA/Smf involved in DNA uptake